LAKDQEYLIPLINYRASCWQYIAACWHYLWKLFKNYRYDW